MYFAHRLNQDTELHLLEPRHAEELFTLVDANRAHLRPWMPWVDETRSMEDIQAFRRRSMQHLAENGCFEVAMRYRGSIAGVVGVHAIDWVNRCTALGYWVGEAYQGCGLVTTACRAIISHLFHCLQLQRVEIHAATGNARSRAVANRLGFTHEGTRRQSMRIGDRYLDMEMYAMLRDDWADPSAEIAFSHPLSDEAELRILQPHYADEIFALTDRNRAHLRPWMSWMDGTTQVEHSRGFIRHALQSLAEGTGLHWGIWHRGQFAGGMGTVYVDHANKKAEIGYWIAEEFQGRGLVTMAGRAMLAYLFNVLDMQRVEIRFRAVNTRSQAVADRLGFTREGIQRQAYRHDEQASDIVCTALLREEWERHTNASA